MKKLLRIAAAAVLLAGIADARRLNQIITITAGTPIHLSATTLSVNRLFIQMVHGGTGIGYVCTTTPGTTPAASCGTAGQLAGEMAPATATAPGGGYSDAAFGQTPIDLSWYWIDGSHSGDTVIVSYNTLQ